MAEFTPHAKYRACQRHLSEDAVSYIIQYGQRFNKAGAQIFYLRLADLPACDQAVDERVKLVGSAVILNRDGELILTVWRNRRSGLRHIKRKPEYDNPRLGDRSA